jgi:large subunit ribosomal protein L3
MASASRRNQKAILGKKIGMTQIFGEDGSIIPVTVLEVGPCAVLQVKTEAVDGYTAFQIGFDDRRRGARRPQQALCDSIGTSPKRFVREVPFVDPADCVTREGTPREGVVAAGDQIGVASMNGVARVDIQGVTKGRGFSGTIKRHGFQRGRDGHGSKNVREPGSTGQHTDPGRVFKGKHMPGHYGSDRRKTRNLDVVKVDEANHILVVRGAVPGPNGGYVYIEESLATK